MINAHLCAVKSMTLFSLGKERIKKGHDNTIPKQFPSHTDVKISTYSSIGTYMEVLPKTLHDLLVKSDSGVLLQGTRR